jgi:hypothetical protein
MDVSLKTFPVSNLFNMSLNRTNVNMLVSNEEQGINSCIVQANTPV